MKNLTKLLVIVVLGAVLCLPGMASGYYIETFSGDKSVDYNYYWASTYINHNIPTPGSDASWSQGSSSGGNPDGYIAGAVAGSSSYPFLYTLAPNVVSPYGALTGTLTTDFKIISGTVANPTTPQVCFYVGNTTNGYNFFVSKFPWNPNNDTSWTTHSVRLLEADWQVWPNQNAGTMSFASVMAQPTDLGLLFFGEGDLTLIANLGFSSTDGAILQVDNFGTAVPLPPAALLLGSGLFGLAIYRRVVKK